MSGLLGDIGTIEWSRRTKGILGRGEQARFTAAVVLADRALAAAGDRLPQRQEQLRTRPLGADPARHAVREGGRRGLLGARPGGDRAQLPLLSCSPAPSAWSRALECDEEALFATTMFHDYAFPEMDSLTDRCFAVAGAEGAERFLESSPLSEDQRHDVLDAICLHINPWVDRERGALQYLAHDGIALDVVGMRAWELDRAGTHRVFEPPSPPRLQRACRHEDEAARQAGPRPAALFRPVARR